MGAVVARAAPVLRPGAHDGQGARRVVGADNVHEVIEDRARVVLAQALHLFGKVLGRRAAQKAQDAVAQRVVHDAVELAALEIAAADRVADLVRGVLPHLAHDERVRLFAAGGRVELLDESVGQLVGHVQAPARRAQRQPAADDAVLVLDDIVQVLGVELVDLGQRVNAPPRAVLVGPVRELVPLVIGRVLRLEGADAVIVAAGVEVEAVIAVVAEHAVQDDAHAALGRLGAQRLEVLLGAHHGVDGLIVAGVIAVVGVGLEDGVKVDGLHVQGLQIVELGQHALEAAAEEVVVQDLAVGVRLIDRDVVPVLVHDARRAVALLGRHLGAAEAVGEDIVGDAAAEPARDLVGAVIDGELVKVFGRGALIAHAARAPADILPLGAAFGLEIVPVQAGLCGGEAGGVAVARACQAVPVHGDGRGLVAVRADIEGHAAQEDLPRRIDRKAHRGPGRHGAIGLLAGGIPGLKNSLFKHTV